MSQMNKVPIGKSRDDSHPYGQRDAQTLYESFQLALNAVASAREEGHITDEELDLLLREMVATLIATELDSMVFNSITRAIPHYSRNLRHRRTGAARRFNLSHRFATLST